MRGFWKKCKNESVGEPSPVTDHFSRSIFRRSTALTVNILRSTMAYLLIAGLLAALLPTHTFAQELPITSLTSTVPTPPESSIFKYLITREGKDIIEYNPGKLTTDTNDDNPVNFTWSTNNDISSGTEIWETECNSKQFFLITESTNGTSLTSGGININNRKTKNLAIFSATGSQMFSNSTINTINGKKYEIFNNNADFITYLGVEPSSPGVLSANGSIEPAVTSTCASALSRLFDDIKSGKPIDNGSPICERGKPSDDNIDPARDTSCTKSVPYFYPLTDSRNVLDDGSYRAIKKLQDVAALVKDSNSGNTKILEKVDAIIPPGISTIEDVRHVISEAEDLKIYKSFYNSSYNATDPSTQLYPNIPLSEITMQHALSDYIDDDGNIKNSYGTFSTIANLVIASAPEITFPAILKYIVGTKIDSNLADNKVDAMIKGKIKVYFIANYIVWNNDFNHCLKSKNDTCAVTNDDLAKEIVSLAQSELVLSDRSDAVCPNPGYHDVLNIKNSIFVGVCTMLHAIYTGSIWLMDLAQGYLKDIIGYQTTTQ